MSDLGSPTEVTRRRRADAERSIVAILAAAERVLGERADASMDDIARSAGISRQTIYSHFPSRDALLEALLARITQRVVSAINEADLTTGSVTDALMRFLEIGWQAFEGDPFLLHLATAPKTPEQERDQHEPIIGPLRELISRGQREGEFDPSLPASWLLAATISLGHAAGEEVRAGRMSTAQGIATLRGSIPRLFAKPPSPPPP